MKKVIATVLLIAIIIITTPIREAKAVTYDHCCSSVKLIAHPAQGEREKRLDSCNQILNKNLLDTFPTWIVKGKSGTVSLVASNLRRNPDTGRFDIIPIANEPAFREGDQITIHANPPGRVSIVLTGGDGEIKSVCYRHI
ncbi:MAG: hypothetical protein F6J86_41085 [Symploca sp. SIO1B1]|nr:hypothetical protein [Symploca sp. SIO1B1]